MKRMIRGTAILAGLVLAITACGGAGDSKSGDSNVDSTVTVDTSAAGNEVKVALVMSGSITDGGWNQGAYTGLEELSGAGFTTKYSENVQQADISSVLEGYAKDGFSLVIGHGYEFGSAVFELAPKYPDTSFFATTFTPDPTATLPINLAFVDPQYYKIAYSTGVLAAMMSTGGTVGVVGGGDNPTQSTMIKAFQAGALSVNQTKALDVLTGSYDDPQKGKEAALAMIGQGADVIAHFANTTGLGALQAAVGKSVKVIGFYNDQNSVAPDLMGTSFKIELGKMVEYLGKSITDGSFPGGTEWSPEMSFMWVPIADATDHNSAVVADDVWAKFKEIYDKVDKGEITVPTS